jgi:putative flavoprotein involved in K+ transport
LNVLDSSGLPLKQSDESVYFVGIPWQTSFASATIRGSGKDAKKAVQSLLKRL